LSLTKGDFKMTDRFADWIGRTESVADVLEPSRTNALTMALGAHGLLEAGDCLPALFHWLYFWTVVPPSGLGIDGHPAKGGFLPPIPLPRRMWAGGRVTFNAPLLLGEAVTRTSTILKIETKTGKSGELVFVTLGHEIANGHGVAVIEEQDLVYRAAGGSAAATANTAPPEVSDALWRDDVNPDPILLFRYSALTMNGHRIHYDRPYAMDEEFYPGLVVHGPLQATLLAQQAQRNLGRPLKRFDFRGQSPAFEGVPLTLNGNPDGNGAKLWAAQRAITMTATAT
jgi:3-methylfumaryl-CoA hydratase